MELEVVKKVKYDVKFLYVYITDVQIEEIQFDDYHIVAECDGDINTFVMYWSPLNADLYNDKYQGICLKIDVDSGNIVNWPANVGGAGFTNVKVVDNGVYDLTDSKNHSLFEDFDKTLDYRYVPKCLQIEENGFDDYLEFVVDENGHINNWKFIQDDFNDILGLKYE